MSGTAEQNGQFPEDHLPGTGLLFDETASEHDTATAPAAPADSRGDGAAGHPAPGAGGAALAGLDAEAVEDLVARVALRRYTKRLEAEVDARLEQLDWSAVTESIEARLAGQVDEAAGVDTSTGEITDTSDTQAPQPDAEALAVEEKEEAPEPAFRTVYDFYEGIYGPLYEHYDSSPGVLAQRGDQGIRWCRQWWNHESVMMRLTALWQAYEVAYAEGGGAVSTWMLDHADRHFDRIMAEGGPLSECRKDHGSNMTRYPVDPLPEGLNLDATTVQPAPADDERKTA